MERAETKEELRTRFHELAAQIDKIHKQWKDVAARDDLPGETRLIARESELLAEIDEVVREFRKLIVEGPSRRGH